MANNKTIREDLDMFRKAFGKTLTVESFVLPNSKPCEDVSQPLDDEAMADLGMDDGMSDNLDTMGGDSDLPETDIAIDAADLSSINDEITLIRQTALKAIARLADKPTSEEYIFMKKIWNMCDKAVENKDGGSDNKNRTA